MLAGLHARGIRPARILEPTCGSGAFLAAAARTFPIAHVVGIEYQQTKYAAALDALQMTQPRVAVQYANAYEVNFAAVPWRTPAGPLLVVGNPPWITAAALGRTGAGSVQPPRSNPRRLRGLAARTGAANFDVAEFLILKLLAELHAAPFHLALLVKESVARNVLTAARQLEIGLAGAEIVRIDARAWFDVAVDACCLILETGCTADRSAPVPIRADFTGDPVAWFHPIAASAQRTDGVAFRQGIKHDAADVFELRLRGDDWWNGYDEIVDVEPEYVYALRKARALHTGVDEATALIVPQQRLGASTVELEARAPLLWRYLHRHAERLAARKSSIYRTAPQFALFGIGPYSFAPWKVAVAGLYAQARFRLLEPHDGRPVMLGDTSYFVPFEQEVDARAFFALSTSEAVREELERHVTRGKRPITKSLLDRVDWRAIAATLDPVPAGLPALMRDMKQIAESGRM